ncbi:MAG: NADPH:quinone oxidoreductase family protein [Actinomycetota bacterium]|nr:NADPH:quinone oxidoreductase family protein [Actinomycetota bacterium]
MRVVSCQAFGPVRDLVVEERPSPPVTPGCVKVAVRATGVNFVDGLMVQGLYQAKPSLPFVPGGELAGVVTELGDGVTSHQVGDRVCVIMPSGCFAEEVVVFAPMAMRSPSTLTDAQAATFVQSYGTSWFALTNRVRTSPGQSLLVLGAGGGVGLAAVDIGRSLGLRVIAAASSADKRELALQYGAESVIDTTTEDLKTRARELSGGGVDYVYDPVGGALAEPAVRALADDGQYLVVGFAAGDIPRLPLNLVLLGNRRIVGVNWGGWFMKHLEQNAVLLAEVTAAIERGELHPVAPTEYPFADAVRALEDQVQRRVAGKAVLVP